MSEDGKFLMHSLSIELPDERSAAVGWNSDDATDTSYYFIFISGSKETKIRLSPEAYDAIILLKPNVDIQRSTGVKFRWRAVEPDETIKESESA